ncbi:alpha/beta hydrolase, partial [Bacillus cereus]
MRIKQLKPKVIWKKRMLLTLFIVFGLIIAGVVFWNVSPIP